MLKEDKTIHIAGVIYHLQHEIGHGTAGTVYTATRSNSDQTVAIKLFKHAYRGVIRETQIMAQSSCFVVPHMCGLDLITDHGCIIMDYIPN